LFLVNASRQKKDTNQIKEENIYREMSRILLQNKPGIDLSLPEIFPLRNLSVRRVENRSLSLKEWINVLS